jgi:hypothetical protein
MAWQRFLVVKHVTPVPQTATMDHQYIYIYLPHCLQLACTKLPHSSRPAIYCPFTLILLMISFVHFASNNCIVWFYSSLCVNIFSSFCCLSGGLCQVFRSCVFYKHHFPFLFIAPGFGYTFYLTFITQIFCLPFTWSEN